MSECSFLSSIFSDCAGLIEIRPLPPERHPPRFFPRVEEAEQYACSLDGEVDVYFGAGTRLRESGTKEDVQEIAAVWADLDTPESVAKLETFPFPPTIVTETSPGRRQAFWLLKEPAVIENDDGALGCVEGVLRGIAEILGSDPAVCEVARITRMLGTMNIKRGAPCRLLRDDGPRHNLFDFIDAGIYRESKAIPAGDNGHGGQEASWVAIALAGVEQGQRNATCARLAGYLIRKHPPDIALAILESYGAGCRPPLSPGEVSSVFESITTTVKRQNPEVIVPEIVIHQEHGTFESLDQTIRKYLLLADPHLLEVTAAALVANRFRSDPLWLLLVQPPSSAKTEILEGTSTIPAVYPLSDLTACTFLSGKDKKQPDKAGIEPSLLPTLDGRIIMMKDFGTVLSMYRDKRQEILAQLREIYDGHYTKRWGTGKEIEWRGHVGFIGGVTTAIDTHYSVLTMLGERFTLYRAQAPDRNKVAERAVVNMMKVNTKLMRAEIAAAFKSWYDALTIPKLEEIACSDEIQQSICRLADLTSLVRTSVARDGYSRLILTRPEAEGPARLARQFYILAAAVAVTHGRMNITNHEVEIIRTVARSTMPAQRVDALAALLRQPTDVWTRTRDLGGSLTRCVKE